MNLNGKLEDICNNGDVKKLGTATIGGANAPVYLKNGTPTACNNFIPTQGGTFNGDIFVENPNGFSFITLGNRVDSWGGVRLYSDNDHKVNFYPKSSLSVDRTIELPDCSGDVQVASAWTREGNWFWRKINGYVELIYDGVHKIPCTNAMGSMYFNSVPLSFDYPVNDREGLRIAAIHDIQLTPRCSDHIVNLQVYSDSTTALNLVCATSESTTVDVRIYAKVLAANSVK